MQQWIFERPAVFDDLSERAERVIFLARLRASVERAPMVEPAHLLAGLILGDQPYEAAGSVEALGTSEGGSAETRIETSTVERPQRPFFSSGTAKSLLARLRKGVAGPEIARTVESVPFSPTSKEILEVAARLKQRLKRRRVTPIHILTAVFMTPGPIAALLADAGILENELLGAALADID